MKSIQQFFLFCAGADHLILKRTPTEINKYSGIGATIFFTGLFAGLTGCYAMYFVFNSFPLAIGLGILWGLMIFNLDRYIVLSMKYSESTAGKLAQAIPRIVLAVLIAFVIAKPFELKLFESEINEELSIIHLENKESKEKLILNRYEKLLLNTETELTNLNNQLSLLDERKTALNLEALKEADGTGGSMKRNMGPIYKAKKLQADLAKKEYQNEAIRIQPELTRLNAVKEELLTERNKEVTQLSDEKMSGLAARMEALERITQRSKAIKIAGIFIMLLFISIETAPIFTKVISGNGPYDYVLDQHEHIHVMHHKLKTTKLEAETNEKVSVFMDKKALI